MKILHSSDLHGSFKKLLNFNDFDVWVDTGDFFPNRTRGDVGVEKEFQTAFFKYNWPHPKEVRLEEAEEELHHAKKELNRFEKEYSRWLATSYSPSKTREARKKWETGIAHRNEKIWDLERNLAHARDDWRDAQKKPGGFKPAYSIGKTLTKWLDGRPLISVPGNHDYVSLANLMKQSGARAYSVTPKGVKVDGVRYSGFREVPWIHGEWAGETHQDEFRGPVGEVFRSPPDILVTHAGPANIMTGSDDWHGGINTLATALSYKPHKIKAHFFGHDHDFGSQTREEMGVLFSNSATKPKIVTVPGLAVNNPSKKRKPRVPKRRSVVHELHILKTPKAGAHTPKKGKKGYQRREKHPKRIQYNPARDVFDPTEEQKRAQVQGIYESEVRRMLGLPYTTPFRDSKGKRLDVKHGVVGPSTWGMQGGHRIKYGSRDYLEKARDRYRDVDHLIRNRQDYEETLALQRKGGFYRVLQEPTKDGLRFSIWPMPPGIELPMVGDNASKAKWAAEMLNQQHDPRRTGKWWKPPRQKYTRSEVDYWLPPASAFKS